jgi:hypothetical protein
MEHDDALIRKVYEMAKQGDPSVVAYSPRQLRAFIPYEIPMEDGESVRLVLPAVLTQAEADRICGVVQALAFADAEDVSDGA